MWTEKSTSTPPLAPEHSELLRVFSAGRTANHGELIWAFHCRAAEVQPRCMNTVCCWLPRDHPSMSRHHRQQDPGGQSSLGKGGGVHEPAGNKDTRGIPKEQTHSKGQLLGQTHSSGAACPSGSRWLFYSRLGHSPGENLFRNGVLSPFLNLLLGLRHHQSTQPRATTQRFSVIVGKEKEHSYLFILFLIKGANCRGKRPGKTFLITQAVHTPAGCSLPLPA